MVCVAFSRAKLTVNVYVRKYVWVKYSSWMDEHESIVRRGEWVSVKAYFYFVMRSNIEWSHRPTVARTDTRDVTQNIIMGIKENKIEWECVFARPCCPPHEQRTNLVYSKGCAYWTGVGRQFVRLNNMPVMGSSPKWTVPLYVGLTILLWGGSISHWKPSPQVVVQAGLDLSRGRRIELIRTPFCYLSVFK